MLARLTFPLLGLGAVSLTACLSSDPASRVETIDVREYARTPEIYRGRVIRVCGKHIYRDEQPLTTGVFVPSARLTSPIFSGRHTAEVSVLGCAGAQVPVDNQGCVTGRIALHDGTVEIDPEAIYVSSPGGTYPWFMHLQCRSAEGGSR